MIDHSKKLKAQFYETAMGRKPVRDWLMELDDKVRRIIGFDIQTVEFGWPLGMPTCRSLGNGMWEIRSNLSDGKIARVIFIMTNGAMVLLHGFVKKTQKTSTQDIDLAEKRRKDIE